MNIYLMFTYIIILLWVAIPILGSCTVSFWISIPLASLWIGSSYFFWKYLKNYENSKK